MSNGADGMLPIAIPQKRKQEFESEIDSVGQHANGTSESGTLAVFLQESLSALRGFDSRPSILEHTLSKRTLGEPEHKKAALDLTRQTVESIQERINSAQYNNVADLFEDVDRSIEAVLKSKGSTVGGDPDTKLHHATDLSIHTAAFRKYLESLIFVNKHRFPGVIIDETKLKVACGDNKTDAEPTKPRTALTIYAMGASGPTQMFSGLMDQATPEFEDGSPDVKTELTVAGAKLPNGIFSTNIMPASFTPKEKPAKRTFGKVFAPLSTLAKFEPPVRIQTSNSETKTIGFVQAKERPAHKGQKSDFRNESLPTGLWLKDGFSRGTSAYDAARRQKYSTYDGPLSDNAFDNLVVSAFSSFAPSRDNSTSVVPRDLKNHLWWTRQKSQVDTPYPSEGLTDDAEALPDLNLKELEEAIQNYVPEDAPEHAAPGHHPDLDADTQTLLNEISDLLVTLNSFAKIRNLALPSTSGENSVPVPSTEERQTYETLKTALTMTIVALPPHLVAKLDGEQLKPLDVSTNVLVEAPEHVGLMEEDPHSAARRLAEQRVAARQTPATPIATPVRSGSYSGAAGTNFTPRPGYPTVSRQPPAYNSQQAYYGQRPVQQQTPRPAPSTTSRLSHPGSPYVQQQTPSQHLPTFPPRPGVVNGLRGPVVGPVVHSNTTLQRHPSGNGSPQKPQVTQPPQRFQQPPSRYFQQLPQQRMPQTPTQHYGTNGSANTTPTLAANTAIPTSMSASALAATTYQNYHKAAADLYAATSRPQQSTHPYQQAYQQGAQQHINSRPGSSTPQPRPNSAASMIANGVSGSATPDRKMSSTPGHQQNGTPGPGSGAQSSGQPSASPAPSTTAPKVEAS